MYIKAISGFACTCMATASIGAPLVITAEQQQMLTAEAHRLHDAAVKGELDLSHQQRYAVIAQSLTAALERWRKLPATDLARSAFSGCSGAVSDVSDLAAVVLLTKDPADAKRKQQYLHQDYQRCNQALTSPRAAFRELRDFDDAVVIE